MARVYQESHMLDNLSLAVKQLQAQTNDLIRSKNNQEEKIKNLTTTNQALLSKNEELQTRMKANEHNAVARMSNLALFVAPPAVGPIHSVLTPLWDVGTGRPMRNFPKHARDVKTMGQADVIQCLQALGIKTLGSGAAEKKERLKKEIGIPPGVE